MDVGDLIIFYYIWRGWYEYKKLPIQNIRMPFFTFQNFVAVLQLGIKFEL